jgi:hypothetical protein
MTKKFAVLNPLNGSYTKASTTEERNSTLADFAWKIYLSHTHNLPYSVVEINDDGSETWRNPQGDEIENLEKLYFEILKLIPNENDENQT